MRRKNWAAVIFARPAAGGTDLDGGAGRPGKFLDSNAGLSNRNAAGPFVQGKVRDATGETVINDQIVWTSAAKELISTLESAACVKPKMHSLLTRLPTAASILTGQW